MKPEELTTNRLLLRRAKEGDAKHLFLYTNDTECSRFLTRKPHTHIAQTQNFLNKWCDLAWKEESDNFSWVVSLKSNDEAIGVFLVTIESHKAQVHFGIRREFWRQGYTSELLQAGSHWLLCNEKLQRVWAVCDLENMGSLKALESSGFKKEGTLRKWLILPAFGKPARDCYMYARLKEDILSGRNEFRE